MRFHQCSCGFGQNGRIRIPPSPPYLVFIYKLRILVMPAEIPIPIGGDTGGQHPIQEALNPPHASRRGRRYDGVVLTTSGLGSRRRPERRVDLSAVARWLSRREIDTVGALNAARHQRSLQTGTSYSLTGKAKLRYISRQRKHGRSEGHAPHSQQTIP